MEKKSSAAVTDRFELWRRLAERAEARAGESKAPIYAGTKRQGTVAVLAGDDSWQAVAYPVRLTKLVFEARPSVLYVDEERPITNQAILVDRTCRQSTVAIAWLALTDAQIAWKRRRRFFARPAAMQPRGP